MRISTGQFYEVSAANYQRTYANVIASGNEVASQVKLNTASDDPVGAARVLQLQQQNAMLAQYKSNISTVNSNATQAETAMESIKVALQRAQELIIGANNATFTDKDRQANASELVGIQKEIAGLMNSQDASGKYLFAGSKVDTPPYALNADGTYSYKGDQTSIMVAVGDGLQVASNTTGWQAFEQAVNTTRTTATPTAMNDGKVQLSGGIVTSSADYNSKFISGQPYTISFESSTQIKILDAGNNDVTAEASQAGAFSSANASSQSVTFRGVTMNLNVNLTDAERATTATADAAVAGHTFNLAISASDVSTTRTPSNASTAVISSSVVTNASDYNKTFPEGGAIMRFETSGTMSLYSAPYTAGDTPVSTGALVTTAPVPPATTPTYSATASGVTFNFSEAPQVNDQFVANSTTNQTQNVLNTLTSAIKALQTPADGNPVAQQKLLAAMDSALGNVKSSLDQIGTAIADGGSRQNVATAQGTTNDTQSGSNDTEQSSITDADPVASIAKLTLQKTMLTASQLVFTQVSQLNLFSKL